MGISLTYRALIGGVKRCFTTVSESPFPTNTCKTGINNRVHMLVIWRLQSSQEKLSAHFSTSGS